MRNPRSTSEVGDAKRRPRSAGLIDLSANSAAALANHRAHTSGSEAGALDRSKLGRLTVAVASAAEDFAWLRVVQSEKAGDACWSPLYLEGNNRGRRVQDTPLAGHSLTAPRL